MVEVLYTGGRPWDATTQTNGPTGPTHHNESRKQGIVSSKESQGLFVDIDKYIYFRDFALITFAAVVNQAVAPSDTNYVFLNDANTLVINQVGFPGSGYFQALAVVTTNGSQVLTVDNLVIGSSSGFLTPSGGAGDVVGPGSSTDHAVARYDGTSGKILLDSGTTIDDAGNMQVNGNIGTTGTVDGRDVAADGTKIDTVETNADVTDAANVNAAGALMNTDFTQAGELVAGLTTPSTFGILAPGSIGQLLRRASNSFGLEWFSASTFAATVALLKPNATPVESTDIPTGLVAVEWDNASSLFVGNIQLNGSNDRRVAINENGKYIIGAIHQLSGSGAACTTQILEAAANVLAQGTDNEGGGVHNRMFTILGWVNVTAQPKEILLIRGANVAISANQNETVMFIVKVSD